MFKNEIKQLLTKEKQTYIEQHVLVLVIVCLINNDIPLAEKLYQEYCGEIPGFIKSSESMAASNLIDYYQQGDQQAFDKMCLRPPISVIYPNNIVRKLRKLKVKAVIDVSE